MCWGGGEDEEVGWKQANACQPVGVVTLMNCVR